MKAHKNWIGLAQWGGTIGFFAQRRNENGHQRDIAERARDLNIRIKTSQDDLFLAIFPLLKREEMKSVETMDRECSSCITSIAGRYRNASASKLAKRLLKVISDGTKLKHAWPDMRIPFVRTLAKKFHDKSGLLRAFIKGRMHFLFIEPLIVEMASENSTKARTLRNKLLFDDSYAETVFAHFALAEPQKAKVEARLLTVANRSPRSIRLLIDFEQIPNHRIERFVRDGGNELRIELAEIASGKLVRGEKQDSGFLNLIAMSIIDLKIDGFQLCEFIKHVPKYGYLWLESRLRKLDRDDLLWDPYDTLREAADTLDDIEKENLIKLLDRNHRFSRKAASAIAGGDESLFALLLESSSPKAVKLAPTRKGDFD